MPLTGGELPRGDDGLCPPPRGEYGKLGSMTPSGGEQLLKQA